MDALRPSEILLAGRLLAVAADQFSNHGCNDMPMEHFEGIGQFERERLERDYNRWAKNTADPVPFQNIGDDGWMHYLAARLKGE